MTMPSAAHRISHNDTLASVRVIAARKRPIATQLLRTAWQQLRRCTAQCKAYRSSFAASLFLLFFLSNHSFLLAYFETIHSVVDHADAGRRVIRKEETKKIITIIVFGAQSQDTKVTTDCTKSQFFFRRGKVVFAFNPMCASRKCSANCVLDCATPAQCRRSRHRHTSSTVCNSAV